jgi:hypothetical protein
MRQLIHVKLVYGLIALLLNVTDEERGDRDDLGLACID